MPLNPDAFYIVCVFARGNRYWSPPLQGRHCSSSNVKRNTVEQIGSFLGSLAFYDLALADRIEVYIIPSPILVL
jgi:hypothetical protein